MVPPPICTYATPYFWLAMLDYSHYTGDTTFDARILRDVSHQANVHGDFMPLYRFDKTTHGDLARWGWFCMNAAERKFRDNEWPQEQWLGLANQISHFLAAQWNVPENSAIGGLRFTHRWNEHTEYILYCECSTIDGHGAILTSSRNS